MRTNIEIDDELMRAARKLTPGATKRDTVDLALRELVARSQRAKILELRGKFDWQGDLRELRRDRS